ncbi:hypothetical protein BH20ACI4_BH20ACI4_26050 [soil metagenome]
MSENKITFLPLKSILGDRRLRKRLRPEYIAACRFFSAPLIDRTGTLDAGIEFEILDRLKGFSETEKSFSEICAERAAFIAQKSLRENRKVQILWSGGIDSTLALVSIFKELEKCEKLNSLEILLSKESVAEYPAFFRDVIEKKINYIFFEPPIYDYLDEKKIIVTGEHGDQIFGSDKVQHFIVTNQAFRPFEEILPFVIGRKLGSTESVDAIISYLMPQIEKSPVKIKTLFDFLWWMNFSLKWQHVSLRMFYEEEDERFSLDKNFIHFFSAKDFQNWSISNHKFKIKQTWKSYKYVAKECIYDFHKDENYLLNKEKEQSLKDAIISQPNFLGFIKRPFKKLFLPVKA